MPNNVTELQKLTLDVRTQIADVVSNNASFILPEDKKDDFIKWFEKKAEKEIETLSDLKRREVVLYPPGKCLHFYRDGVGVSCVQAPCTFFNEFDVNRTMLDDHLIPTGYEVILLETMRSHLKNPNFQFDAQVSNGLLLELLWSKLWGQWRALRLLRWGHAPWGRNFGNRVR